MLGFEPSTSLQSSVNYSKKAIRNHHGAVPVVVQKEKKLNTYNTKSKTKQNKNKKQQQQQQTLN